MQGSLYKFDSYIYIITLMQHSITTSPMLLPEILIVIFRHLDDYAHILYVCKKWAQVLSRSMLAPLSSLTDTSLSSLIDTPSTRAIFRQPAMCFKIFTLRQKILLTQELCNVKQRCILPLKTAYMISWPTIVEHITVSHDGPLLHWLFRDYSIAGWFPNNVLLYFRYLLHHYEQYRRYIFDRIAGDQIFNHQASTYNTFDFDCRAYANVIWKCISDNRDINPIYRAIHTEHQAMKRAWGPADTAL